MTTFVSIVAKFGQVAVMKGAVVSPYTLHATFADTTDDDGNLQPAIEASMKWLLESGMEDGKIIEFTWKAEVGK